MKRLGAIFSLALIIVMLSAGVCFAGEGDLKIKENYPEDKATGTSVDNLSVKLYFNEDVKPKDKKTEKANEKAVKLVDNKGKEVPILVKYNPDEDKQGQVIILAKAVSASSGDDDSDKAKIKSKTKYTLTVDGEFTASNGDTLGETAEISFTTVDQGQAMKVQMIMMGVMVVVMIYFTSRSAKKQAEKDMQERKKQQAVNPYKVAKKTGKSVEEVVRKEQQKKAKQAAAEERKKAKNEKNRDSAGKLKNEIASDNKRVSAPRPISAAGSKYVADTKKKAQAPQPKKGNTTNPKNQSGKQKNAKNKKKK